MVIGTVEGTITTCNGALYGYLVEVEGGLQVFLADNTSDVLTDEVQLRRSAVSALDEFAEALTEGRRMKAIHRLDQLLPISPGFDLAEQLTDAIISGVQKYLELLD